MIIAGADHYTKNALKTAFGEENVFQEDLRGFIDWMWDIYVSGTLQNELGRLDTFRLQYLPDMRSWTTPAQPLPVPTMERMMGVRQKRNHRFIEDESEFHRIEADYLARSNQKSPNGDFPEDNTTIQKLVNQVFEACFDTSRCIEKEDGKRNHAVKRLEDDGYADVEIELFAWKAIVSNPRNPVPWPAARKARDLHGT